MFDGEEEEVFRGGGVREKGDAVTSSKVCTVHVLRYGICAMYIPVRYFLNQNRPVSAMRQTRQIQNTRRSKIMDFLYQRFVFLLRRLFPFFFAEAAAAPAAPAP